MKSKQQLIAHQGYVLRGMLIDRLIFIEQIMVVYLSYFFCKKNSRERAFYINKIWDTKTFRDKFKSFKTLVNKNNPSFINENPTIFEEIEELITLRNILAHSVLDTQELGLKYVEKKELVFYNPTVRNKKKKHIIFTIDQINNYNIQFDRIINAMKEMVDAFCNEIDSSN